MSLCRLLIYFWIFIVTGGPSFTWYFSVFAGLFCFLRNPPGMFQRRLIFDVILWSVKGIASTLQLPNTYHSNSFDLPAVKQNSNTDLFLNGSSPLFKKCEFRTKVKTMAFVLYCVFSFIRTVLIFKLMYSNCSFIFCCRIVDNVTLVSGVQHCGLTILCIVQCSPQ